MRAFFHLAEAGACELVSSPFAVDEARRNIARKRPSSLVELEALVARLALSPEAGAAGVLWARSTGLPDKDAPILAAAAAAGADLLVTGDRADFGPLYGKRFRGVEVLPPRTAIERILAAKR